MKLKFLFLINIFFYTNNLELKEHFKKIELNNQSDNDSNNIIIPGIIQTFFIKSNAVVNFTVNPLEYGQELFIHFFSINCEIKELLDQNSSILKKQHDNDSYSMKITSGNEKAIPIIAFHKNNNRKCPLVINSFFNGNILKVGEQEPTIFFFDNNLEEIKLVYDFSEIKDKSFISLSFLFNEKGKFLIEIEEIKQIITISNSHNIFLTKEIINLNPKLLTINVKRMDKKHSLIFLTFRVITNNFTPLVLQKNYLNHGFITSNNKYQYYYMEIFAGDEGEIMLHDKRQKGELYGIITNNRKIPINVDDYQKEENDITLKYNPHLRKLNFSYIQTNQCDKGCLLLITYSHDEIDSDDIIGFEFTLLARIWNKDDWSDTNIVNIPNNEYIFGFFDKNKINQHYYSIFVSEETEKIIIEIKGIHYEFFYGEGKRKLNTYNSELNSTIRLGIENEKEVMKEIKVTNFKGKNLSFAIRPNNFFENVASFYYFRIFQLKKDELLIMPLDSNIKNICGSQIYQCYYLLKNDYNQFNLDFIVTSSNYDDLFHYITYDKNNTMDISNEAIENIALNKVKQDTENLANYIKKKDNNLKFILFNFKFQNQSIKNIFSCFKDEKKEIYPQIYSTEIYQIVNESIFNCDLLHEPNYSLNARWFKGSGELHNFIPLNLHMNVNSKGRPYSTPIDSLNKKVNIINIENFSLYFGISFTEENDVIEEIIYGEQISKVIQTFIPPLYFFIENPLAKNKTADINFRIYKYSDDMAYFKIEGAFLSRKFEKNKLETLFYLNFILKGEYDICSKNGLLQIHNSSDNNIREQKYILIKIDEEEPNYHQKKISFQIIPLIKNSSNFTNYLPLNRYISGSLNSLDKEANYIINCEKNFNENLIIEFSKNNPFLSLSVDQEISKMVNNSIFGFEKYIIEKQQNNNLILKINFEGAHNSENLIGNYILRAYYNISFKELEYEFSKIANVIDHTISEDNPSIISFEIENLRIKNAIYNISYKIYCSLFFKEKMNEKLNTLSIISEHPIAQNMVESNNTEDKFLVNFTVNTENISDFKSEIQIKFYLDNYFVNNKILSYSIEKDLNKYLKKKKSKENKNNEKLLTIGFIVVSSLLIIIIIATVIICLKMKKKNEELKDKVLSISFSTGKNEAINSEDSINSKKDEEYESGFI